uniref:Uncharacterized protein n=1 Tax=Anguilla anguilla TaxID=7936 RepID=A0A0E9SPA3_ANGAN
MQRARIPKHQPTPTILYQHELHLAKLFQLRARAHTINE